MKKHIVLNGDGIGTQFQQLQGNADIFLDQFYNHENVNKASYKKMCARRHSSIVS